MKNVTPIKKPNKNANFGKRLEYVRSNLLISQDDLAKKIIVDRTTITKYEKDNRLPELSRLIQICNELKVSADYLLGFSECESFYDDIKIVNKTTGLSDKAIKNLIHLKEFGNGVLLDTINFLLEQEEYPYETEFVNADIKDDEQQKDYDKNIKMWKKKNTQNVLMAIDDYFQLNIDSNHELSITNNGIKTKDDLPNGKDLELATRKKINAKEIIDKVFIDEMNKKIVGARDKFKQGDDE
ncbi:MAG: helix-turn-helix domain-containing protein [Bacilli bacterium]